MAKYPDEASDLGMGTDGFEAQWCDWWDASFALVKCGSKSRKALLSHNCVARLSRLDCVVWRKKRHSSKIFLSNKPSIDEVWQEDVFFRESCADNCAE
jgi:hypothetical protein